MMAGIKTLATLFLMVNTFLLHNVEANDKTNGLDKNGANVCTYVETISKKMNETYLSQRFTTHYFQTCNWLGCKNISRLVTKNVHSVRLVTRYLDRNVHYCCNGWSRKDSSHTQCDVPICNIKCRNGGKCVGPDKCQCKDGFSGSFCQLDNNECTDKKKTGCSQLCINTKGGYRCACNIGYNLQADGKSCNDIDECIDSKRRCGCAKDDGVCKATCHNTQGSYTCKCLKGYYKNSAGLCEDTNECALDQTLCDQKCINNPGNYSCQCFKGFQYDSKNKKCVDTDECSAGKGGCSHKCVNTAGSYVCACPYGKYLMDDGKTCKDVDLNSKSVTFCQSGSIGMLSCDKYTDQINVTSVFYGRVTDKLCQTGDYTSNLSCVADKDADAAPKLSECNGMPSCIVMLDMWKDPCPGVEKYATVNYRCVSPVS